MPNNIVKGFAKKSGKSISDVEKLWSKSKAIVRKEYPTVSVKSPKFFPLVVGTLKNLMDLKEITFKDFKNILLD